MSGNATEREIQKQLEIMTITTKFADAISVIDAVSWKRKREAEQLYLEANDWLIAHGIDPVYDHEQQCYVGRSSRE
jgi:hypothetical protein